MFKSCRRSTTSSIKKIALFSTLQNEEKIGRSHTNQYTLIQIEYSVYLPNHWYLGLNVIYRPYRHV